MVKYIKLTDYETGKPIFIRKDEPPTEIKELDGYGQDDGEYIPDRTRLIMKTGQLYLISEKAEDIISQFVE